MQAIHYAQALHALVAQAKDEDALLKRFVLVLRANGHLHLSRKISRAFERIVAEEERGSTITVSSPHALSESDVAALLKREPFKHAVLPKHRKVLRLLDETLISGVVVRTSTQKIDASGKRALTDLYQSLISR